MTLPIHPLIRVGLIDRLDEPRLVDQRPPRRTGRRRPFRRSRSI
jgi:hypothetical protein